MIEPKPEYQHRMGIFRKAEPGTMNNAKPAVNDEEKWNYGPKTSGRAPDLIIRGKL